MHRDVNPTVCALCKDTARADEMPATSCSADEQNVMRRGLIPGFPKPLCPRLFTLRFTESRFPNSRPLPLNRATILLEHAMLANPAWSICLRRSAPLLCRAAGVCRSFDAGICSGSQTFPQCRCGSRFPHPARDRHHWRKPHLRQHLRHLQAPRWTVRVEPAFRGYREC